jgi:hypothetical protein
LPFGQALDVEGIDGILSFRDLFARNGETQGAQECKQQ